MDVFLILAVLAIAGLTVQAAVRYPRYRANHAAFDANMAAFRKRQEEELPKRRAAYQQAAGKNPELADALAECYAQQDTRELERIYAAWTAKGQ